MDYSPTAVSDENSYRHITGLAAASLFGACISGVVFLLFEVFTGGFIVVSYLFLALGYGIPIVTLGCIILAYAKKSARIAKFGSKIALIPIAVLLVGTLVAGIVWSIFTLISMKLR